MERGEALAGSGPADHLCDPPSRELCNPLMRRPLRPYTKIVDATVGSTSDFIGARLARAGDPSPQQVGPSVDDLPGNFRHLKLNSTSPINGEQNLSL